jgi:predicted dehydrogenase
MKHLTQIGFGFIGAGAITHYSAESLSKHPQVKLVSVYDPHEGRAKALGEKFKFDSVTTDLEKFLNNKNIDAVYIATPNKFHVPLTLQVLKAGKHVILEKPFALNYAEAKQAVDAAKAASLVFTLGMNQRFNADSQRVKQLVDQGGLGDIYHAKAYWLRRTGIPKLHTWFGNRELAGAGCLYDIGVHMLDLTLYTINNYQPVSVTGATYTKFGDRDLGEGGWGLSDKSDLKFDVEDFASAFIRFANGATVTLDVTWAAHRFNSNSDNVELFGTEGGASLRPAKYFRFAQVGNNKPVGYDVVEDLDAPLAMPHADRFHNFANHLLGKEELVVTTDQALTVQKILDAIAESSRLGKEVRIG